MADTPVLVIEDNPEHYRQIEEAFGTKYQLRHIRAIEHELIYNYKAVHRDSQIVVVDLNLGGSAKFDYREGLEVVRRKLWPVDRNALFVVFSEWIPDDLHSPLNRVEPHWAFVKKEFATEGPGVFSTECLQNLENVVSRCSECCAPSFEIPRHETFELLSEFSRFLSGFELVSHAFQDVVRQGIVESANILEQLSRAAAPYVKAGRACEAVGIGIYGSCGRMEVRVGKSDIEASAYYCEGGQSLPHRELAITLWNRLIKVMEKEQYQYEGVEFVVGNQDRLLHSTQVGDELPNQFCPVIPINSLLSASLEQEPHLRNRHLQTLTELRPVFNPDLFYRLKRELITKNVGRVEVTRWDIVTSRYLEDICTQYFLDNKPTSVSDFKGRKRFVLRVLNLLALRLLLIWWLMRDKAQPMRTGAEWKEFLDSLCDPGIVKVARFGNWCLEQGVQSTADSLVEIVQEYTMVFGRFDQAGDLGGDLRRLGESFVRLLGGIRDDRRFQLVKSASWILNTDTLTTMLGRL